MPVNRSHLRFAMDRIDDFGAVHAGDDIEGKVDALLVVLEAIGLDETAVYAMMEWIRSKDGHGQEGAFILGVIVGIMAYENMIEKEN